MKNKEINNFDFRMVSADTIYNLSKDHPAVHIAVTLFRRGEMTWEQMLIGLVEFLAEQNKNMFDALAKQEMSKTNPPVIWEENINEK